MNLLEAFKSFLFSQNNKPAKVTVKNYLSDVNHFIRWYENIYQKRLSPSNITAQVIKDYKEANISGLSASSMERHLSSLRKFFSFLKLEGQMTHSPFEELAGLNKKVDDDPWHLKDFKNYLYVCNASHLTIKNYIIDIKQFFTWAQASTAFDENATANSQDVLGTIDSKLVEEYKKRLLNEGSFSPATINRKLSSLRKYSAWAQGEGLIKGMDLPVPNAELPAKETAEAPMFIPFATEAIEIPKIKEYSKFPPIRLMQKMGEAISLGVDNSLIIPLANLISKTEYLVWKTKGKQVFTAASTSGLKLKAQNEKLKSYLVSHKPLVVKSFSKEFYAPHKISTKYFPFYKKVLFHARYTRPNWYKTYHSYAITHYFHFAVLIIFLVSISFGFFNAFVQKPQSQNPALATGPTAPPRVLSFQEKLTDNNNNPITTPTYLRFIVYNDMAASGSARLWEEVDRVNPDPDGIFNVTLGNGAVCNSGNPPSSPAAGACAIPQSLFAQGSTLWVGVTIGATPELTPRQQLATAAYATNAETLQGLSPITQAGAGTSNVVLALDSSGNLTIGDSANPTFQAIGGQFTLLGQPLFLTTNQGSNANVTISADGLGKIALDKPLTNTSFSNNIPSAAGSVEVDDLFSVLATSSGQSALTINQTSTGPLISASTSGIAKFTVDSSGNVTAAGGLTSSGNFLQNGVTTFKTGTGLVSINGNLNTNLIPNTALNLGSSGNNWGRIYGTTFYGGNNAGLTLGTASCVKTNGGIVIGSGPCPGGSNSSGPFAEITASGVIVPNNSAEDFLIGGQSFTSAKFALLNIAGTRGTQLASLSGSLTLDSATASIQTTKNQLLTLGGSTTGNIQFKPGNSSTSLYLNSTGNVGIGTTTPRTALDVVGSSLATASAFIENSNTTTGTVGLALKMGATSPDTSTHFVNFLDTNGNIVGDIRFATSSTIAYQTNGIADFAEYLKKDKDQPIDWGLVLCENTKGNVEPCTSGSTHIIGVASEFPSFVGGKDLGDSSITVGLQGVVSTNVSNANGNIQAGDFVTSSQTPGIGVKAITPGQTVGIALSDFTPNSPSPAESATNSASLSTQQGKILVRVNPSWFDPSVYLTDKGNIGNLITAKGADTAIRFEQNGLSILNSDSASSASVITFDNLGNATFSGTLSANVIKANRIEGLEVLTDKLSNLDNTLATLSSSLNSPPATQSSIFDTSRAVNISSLNISGLTTVGGDLRVKGNSLIEGILTVIDTITTKDLIVSNLGYFMKDVTFKGNTSFEGRPTFNSDTGGFAVIKKGDTGVTINFDNEYENMPIVTAGIVLDKNTDTQTQQQLEASILNNNTQYLITQRTTKGFTIKLNQNAPQDISFSWIALSIKDAKTTQSNGSTQVLPTPTQIPLTITPTPIDNASQSATPTPSIGP